MPGASLTLFTFGLSRPRSQPREIPRPPSPWERPRRSYLSTTTHGGRREGTRSVPERLRKHHPSCLPPCRVAVVSAAVVAGLPKREEVRPTAHRHASANRLAAAQSRDDRCRSLRLRRPVQVAYPCGSG